MAFLHCISTTSSVPSTAFTQIKTSYMINTTFLVTASSCVSTSRSGLSVFPIFLSVIYTVRDCPISIVCLIKRDHSWHCKTAFIWHFILKNFTQPHIPFFRRMHISMHCSFRPVHRTFVSALHILSIGIL